MKKIQRFNCYTKNCQRKGNYKIDSTEKLKCLRPNLLGWSMVPIPVPLTAGNGNGRTTVRLKK